MRANAERVKSMAKRLRFQANNLKMDNFLSFIYTSEILNGYLNKELRGFRLNKTQMSILHILITHSGAMTPTELSVRILRSVYATAKSIDKLDKLGLTKSTSTKQDRRLRIVSVTEKGLDLVEDTMVARQDICTQVMNCLKQEEAETFQGILKRLRKHVLRLMTKP